MVLATTKSRGKDQLLVDRCLQGDDRAMGEIYLQHGDKVFALAMRLTGNRGDAEDVVQDTFLRAWRNLARFRGDASLGTWLYRIALNCCRDLNKRRRPVAGKADGVVLPQAADVLARKRLEIALARLPAGYREVIILRDVMELGHAEVAEVLKISVGTSKSQLHKARAQLRRIWSEQLGSQDRGADRKGGQL